MIELTEKLHKHPVLTGWRRNLGFNLDLSGEMSSGIYNSFSYHNLQLLEASKTVNL